MGYGLPLASAARYETLGAGTGTGTTVTAGSANVKGSYATIGTASFGYDGIFVTALKPVGTGVARGRLDIATNTGGSDQIVVADWYWSTISGFSSGGQVQRYLPVRIPAGATVKARWQSATGSATLSVMIVGMQGDARQIPGFRAIASLTDFTNSDPSNSVTLSGTTQTAWTQVIASSGSRVTGVIGNLADLGTALGTAVHCLIDIGWGGAGSERVLSRSLHMLGSNIGYQQIGPLPCDFPAGTRFAFRAQCSAADTNVLGLALNGLVP
ncbi:MAG TPA: hypothetical protein VEC60_18815 [Reyranella sp.]|nr:hypothetical protein [Reyranella sp.]